MCEDSITVSCACWRNGGGIVCEACTQHQPHLLNKQYKVYGESLALESVHSLGQVFLTTHADKQLMVGRHPVADQEHPRFFGW